MPSPDWPVLATWAVLTAPFLARSTIAGINWWRVNGRLTYMPNVNPRVETTDFPQPNRAGRELIRYWLIALVTLPVAFWVGAVLGKVVPTVAWQALFVVVAGPTVIWIFRRLHSDDQLWLRLKKDRIVQDAIAASRDIPNTERRA